jgi:hypothetical protein
MKGGPLGAVDHYSYTLIKRGLLYAWIRGYRQAGGLGGQEVKGCRSITAAPVLFITVSMQSIIAVRGQGVRAHRVRAYDPPGA